MKLPRIRISTLMLAVLVVALVTAFFTEQYRYKRALAQKEEERQAALSLAATKTDEYMKLFRHIRRPVVDNPIRHLGDENLRAWIEDTQWLKPKRIGRASP